MDKERKRRIKKRKEGYRKERKNKERKGRIKEGKEGQKIERMDKK